MSFEKGQRVIYDGRELCRIDELCTKCFDGVHREEYLRLIPEGAPASCYYVPADRIGDRVRPLMTKEEKSRRKAEGKELIACDEKALSAACRQIGAEFSAVLDIPENEVGRLIEKRLSENR